MKRSGLAPVRGAALLILVLAGCGGGGGGGGPSESIILIGRVGLLADLGGQVTATTGAKSASAPIQGDGSYSISLTGVSLGDQVSISARGSDSSRTELESLLGSVGRLQTLGGSDGNVTAEESARLQLNNFNTALSALIRRLGFVPDTVVTPAGNVALSDAQLDTAESAVDIGQALLLGAALDLAAAGNEVGFPEGFETTLELALDANASREFVELQLSENSVALDQALEALTDELSLGFSFSAAELPSLAHFATVSATLVFDAHEFMFSPDGTGLVRFGWGLPPDAINEDTMTWSVVDGVIITSLDNGIEQSFSFFEDDGAGGQVEVTGVDTVDEFEIRGLRESVNGIVSIRTVRGESTYTSPPDRPSEEFDFQLVGLFVGSDDIVPYENPDVAGRILSLQIYNPDGERGGGSPAPELQSDLLQFNAEGTGLAQLSGQAISWSIVGGELRVTFPTGAQGTYRRLFALGNNGQFRVAALLQSPEGLYYPTAVPSSIVNPFEAPQADGDYHQSGVGTEEFVDVVDEFVIRLNPDNSAFYIFRETNPDTGEIERFDDALRPWRIDPNTNEVILEYSFDEETFEQPCDTAASASCFVFDQRRARVLSRSGNREFWLEKRRRPCAVEGQEFCGPGITIEDAPADFLLRFYDVEPAGSFTAGSSGSTAKFGKSVAPGRSKPMTSGPRHWAAPAP